MSIILKFPPRYLRRRRIDDDKNAYKIRDKTLYRLGFASYLDYLRSDLWKMICAAKLEIDPRCELCGDKGQSVHHLSYRRAALQGKRRHKLVTLCNHCHKDIEFRKDGTKRNFEASMKRTRHLLRKQDKWSIHTLKGQRNMGLNDAPPKAAGSP